MLIASQIAEGIAKIYMHLEDPTLAIANVYRSTGLVDVVNTLRAMYGLDKIMPTQTNDVDKNKGQRTVSEPAQGNTDPPLVP